jgi:hypothetical protein
MSEKIGFSLDASTLLLVFVTMALQQTFLLFGAPGHLISDNKLSHIRLDVKEDMSSCPN